MTKHVFKEKLREGEEAERLLDQHFEGRYQIWHATMAGQRKGIDRYFTNRLTGKRFTVDYKTDWRAAQTGNVFIETLSVDTTGKGGWAEESAADWVFYFIPQQRLIYLLKMSVIRIGLPFWRDRYRTVEVENEGYKTHGVLVPLVVLLDHASGVEEIKEAS